MGFLSRYFRAYFTRWWLPPLHYLVAALFLAGFVGTELYAASDFLADVCALLTLVVAVAALGMLVAAFVHYRNRRKLEGLANLVLFACLFLFPTLFLRAATFLSHG